jgi:hypothetical protein
VLGQRVGPQKMLGTMVIRTKRGIQWDRSQIRLSWKGLGPREKKGLKVKGTTSIKMKRGIQWTKSQIRLQSGPIIFSFFTLAELYSNMNTSTMLNSQILNNKKCQVGSVSVVLVPGLGFVGLGLVHEAKLHCNRSIILILGLGFAGFLQSRFFLVL